MKGNDVQLLRFMDGHDKRFVIPVYQRNYDWKKSNCKKLFDDLVKIIRNERPSHFFGSIVYVLNPDSDGAYYEHLIIDGQQRLTTISLLLLAIHNLIEDGVVKTDSPSLSNKILKAYLVDEFSPDETRIKLKPIKNDDLSFHKLFGDSSEYNKNSNLTINYEYFYNRVQKEEISVDDLYKAISRLQIISISLNPDDNPQLIFESLNSTGVDLSEGDKIRNYVLMGQTKNRQNELYDKYWNPIEIATGYDVSSFVRDYLSIKTQCTPSINSVYEVFKAYVQENQIEIEELLKDLFSYSKYYEVLLIGRSSYDELDSKISDELRDIIFRLNWLETTVTRPFLLEILRYFTNGQLLTDEMLMAFKMTENYVFRRFICDVPTNSLNKLFLGLNKEILRYDGTTNHYIDKMCYSLSSKKDSVRFPNDEEFSAALSEKSIYNTRNKYRTYILERFENDGIKESKDVYKLVENGTYSIEHVMPQTLSDKWKAELGRDYKEIHDTWLHRLANLTLTAYNSKYSNEPFLVKRDLIDKETGNPVGFSNSGLRMNQWIGNKDKWTEEELEARNNYLIERALKIWEYANTDYVPLEKPMDVVALDDDVDLTGRTIVKFSFKEIEHSVSSWVDAYVKILKILHEQDETILTHLAYEKNADVELALHVSSDEKSLKTCEEISKGIYIWTGIGTRYKITNLLKFFKMYDVDPQELIFFLKEDNNASGPERVKPRHVARKAYWEYALPIIKSTLSNGCFSNTNPCIQERIHGYFGINGFRLSCVVKTDCARVTLLLYKKDISTNKEAFDYLFSYRDVIEEELGTQIVWDRGKDVRYSRIYILLEDVSVFNEDDYKLMASFHSEWVKKFYDTFVPLLKEKYLDITQSSDELDDDSDDSNMNPSEEERLYFWNRFNDILVERGCPFAVRKASTRHWYNVAIGITGVHVSLILVNREGYVGVELYMRNKKEMFDYLIERRGEIEKELGVNVEWMNDEDKKCSRILHKSYGLNFDDHSNYDQIIESMIDKAVVFSTVFKKYLLKIK